MSQNQYLLTSNNSESVSTVSYNFLRIASRSGENAVRNARTWMFQANDE